MKSAISVFCFSLLPIFHCFCQSPSSQVISAAGDEFKNADISLTWTFGEPIIETLNNSSNTLTQGFNQTKIIVTAIGSIAELSYSVTAYPNPASDFVYLKVESESFKNLEYIFYDSKGTILVRKILVSSIEAIDLRDLTSGVYFLELLDNKKMTRTFKIVKP